MENTTVNRRDHGTWNKHLNVHQSIYIILFTLKYAETMYVYPEHRNLNPCNTNGLKKEPPGLASSPLFI